MTRLLVIKAGTASTTLPDLTKARGDFETWIAQQTGFDPSRVHVARIREGEALPAADAFDAIVITGSGAMVGDPDSWIEALRIWIKSAVALGKPMLGICFGHQIIAHALGGRVDWNPRGREIGTIEIELTQEASSDPLLRDLPSRTRFHATHLQSVLELPPAATRLAFNAHDKTQAFTFGGHVWGVQFHPEFDLEIIRGYIQARQDDLRNEGINPDHVLANTDHASHGSLVLQRFGDFARQYCA